MTTYQILACYFMAHEHLLKAHIYLHTASGDTPALEYRRLRSHISKLVTSRFFQKWCSNGVVSAFPLRETIDFTGFLGTFQDTAVAHEKHRCHGAQIPSSSVFPLYHTTAGPVWEWSNAGPAKRGGSTPCCRPLITCQQRRAGLSTAARKMRCSS